MANRRRNFRRRLNIFDKENKHFKIVTIPLAIIAIIGIVILIYKGFVSYKQKQKVSGEQQKSKNQIESMFQSTDSVIDSANNYKTDVIIRLSIAGIIDSNDIEKYMVKQEKISNEVQNANTGNVKKEEKKEDIFEEVATHLNNSDFTIANYKIGKNRNEDLEDKIKQIGINVLNISNNAVESIDEVCSILNDKGIQTIGNKNKTNESSARVNIVSKKNVNIAFIGYTTNIANNGFSEEKAKEDLEYAKKNASVIIVMMDWKNTNDEETKEQKEQAQFLADNGANLIIGNNQNNIQNMEMIKGENDKDCFVAYSLGNLLSTTNVEKNKTGMILEAQILVDKDGKTSINKIDYISTYIYKKYGNELKKNSRKNTDNNKDSKNNSELKILDLKNEVINYTKDNSEFGIVNYEKMKIALERVQKIVSGSK